MSVLDRIEARHDALPRIEVAVPEWDCTLYFRPDITVAQQRKINAGIDPSETATLVASYIMHEAQLEDGSPAFEASIATRARLESKGGLKVMMRIMSEVGAPESLPAAKND